MCYTRLHKRDIAFLHSNATSVAIGFWSSGPCNTLSHQALDHI